MGKAYFEISMALFHDLLSLPDGVEITGIEQTVSEAHQGFFRVFITGDDLPPMRLGEHVPRMTLMFRQVTQQAVEFEGWQ